MKVGTQIASAFIYAKAQNAELGATWIRLSLRVGSRLPNSLLSVSIQRDGEVDLLLRCMEDENAQHVEYGTESGLFEFHYQKMMSEYWIGSVYETFRLLREKNLAGASSAFDAVFKDLELLRMPLEKHEIAKDKVLKAPLMMKRNPPNNGATDIYVYDPKNDQRAHIMPSGITGRGSVTWQVIDLKAGTDHWVERRDLSDRILMLWKGE